jgi:hypothetical protein
MRCRLALLVFASLAACAHVQAAQVLYNEADSAITVEGPIQQGDDAKFSALLTRHPSKLIIRSDGGSQQPSIAIAREVHARRMTVVVDGFCASACAQIIFAAAEDRRIRPDAFVAFHGGNLAQMQAVRDKLASETALLQRSGESAEGDEKRTAVREFIARSETQIDGLYADQAAFEAEMKLDRGVTDFYEKLTAGRDIRVELKPGDAQPVRVAVGRPGICDWWIPDQVGLEKLGLALRNTYEPPSPEAVARSVRKPVGRLYFGPPVALDDPHFDTLCKPGG